ncbi:MAG: hypothetical protein GX119_07745 [Syntrophomonadaceae bacterium]|nr:hypothetical protein [Syntrophomonadaceae bacterium]
MKMALPPPLTQEPAARSAWQDFTLLLKNQLRLSYKKMRHWPITVWISIVFFGAAILALLSYLGFIAYGALQTMPPQSGQEFLSLLLMMGLVTQVFFGVTAAFATLYMSDDLELLFMAPVSLRAVFAVKSAVVASSNLLTIALFVFLPGLFYGLLFQADAVFYFLLLIVVLGLWTMGTALAELLNMLVMRIVPPHRSREAVGFIGALAAIMIALIFQLPNLMMARGESLDIGSWLTGQEELLRLMDFFPWGWGSSALAQGVAGNFWAGLGWSGLLLAVGAAFFWSSFLLVERGFRRGWINLSQGEARKRKKRSTPDQAVFPFQQDITSFLSVKGEATGQAPLRTGIWAVAKKDLLYLGRDTREWFGYLAPLIIMVFFAGQFMLVPSETTKSSSIMILVIYSAMFSGNLALQSFGREGESEWVLNSVPLAGWPVVWGKLLAAVLPTLLLMEALLVGTAIALDFSVIMTLALAVGAVLLTLGASAIGLFYSINNCRFNPDNPQQRISPGASMIMYLMNFLFMLFLSLGLVYIFPPTELMAVLGDIPPVSFSWSFPELIVYGVYLLSRPFLWTPFFRILLGIVFTSLVWSLVFFTFMAATVRQSRKGFQVQIVTGTKKKSSRHAPLLRIGGR